MKNSKKSGATSESQLILRSERLRILSDSELDEVAGGLPCTITCAVTCAVTSIAAKAQQH